MQKPMWARGGRCPVPAAPAAEEEDDDDDEEAAEMSRLVGRDGYLLPFATNNFHMYQEAQLHRLHHQEPWLDKERAHGYDDRENIFFRAPRECPGWLAGGRYLGHADGHRALLELQEREQSKAVRARQEARRKSRMEAKKEEQRNLKFNSGKTARDFLAAVTAARSERALLEEAQASLDAKGVVIPTREMQIQYSMDKMREDTNRIERKAKTDKEKDNLRSRLMAVHEVATHTSSYTLFSEPLVHEGFAR
eukprot:Tamp_15304.p1 GENE.Tamp_15304~~Tamp_15304.p1  ORF type:complete len:250 (+),score=54.32 Tamp_15304:656-1405(+)